MNTIVMQAELRLQEILDEHEDLLRLARGFGMRTAAIPSRLMPLAEARKIVADFDDNTSKLRNFLSDEVLTMTLRYAPDKETKDALHEIFDRASKSLTKFEDHRTKAKAAIAKHEDLLVGENFQDMFEALRLAVLDLDLTDKADFAAKTQLYLDATPAYAVGLASVWRNNPKEEVYKVRATYKAETDEYVADMWSVYSGRWFPAAKKTGHARIPAFVKAVADKLKAVHDLEGADLLGSRRKVDDTSKEVSGYRGEIESQKRRELVRNGRNEAARRIKEVSQAIDRKLRQRFPKARASVGTAWWSDNLRVAIENTVDLRGDVSTTIVSDLIVGDDGKVHPHIKGFVGLKNYFGPTFSVKDTISGKNDRQYVDEAVKALVKFATPDPADTAKLSSKIEDVASQVLAILSKRPYYGSAGLQYTQVAKGVVRKTYKFWVRQRSGGVHTVEVAIEASTPGSSLKVVVKPFFVSRTPLESYVRRGEAAKKIIEFLLYEEPTLLAELMAPASAPAPSDGSVGGTPTIRELKDFIKRQGYPGNVVEKTLNRVLLDGAPSVTLSTKQHGKLPDDYELVVDMESPQDTRVRAIQDFVLKFQDKIKSSGIKDFTVQLGNLTLTQKVGYSFRIFNIEDASLFDEGRTDDLIRSLTQEFPRRLVQPVVGPSKPKRVIIAALVTLTISRQGAGGRTAGTVRTAGNTTFENVVWIPSVREAFHTVRSEELAVHGHREGYPGHIGGKHTWKVRSDDVMTEAQARAFADKDVNNNDPWDQAAFALRLTKERVLATDKVTVTVTARDEKEALRQANMRIYATGRIPPKAVVKTSELTSKKVSETPRTVTLEVTGTRKIIADGVTDGWMFYGWVKE